LQPQLLQVNALRAVPSETSNDTSLRLFPLLFLSNIFVDPWTLPRGLRPFVDVNPLSTPAGAEGERSFAAACYGARSRRWRTAAGHAPRECAVSEGGPPAGAVRDPQATRPAVG
jgi:hypothetical protein